MMFSPSKPDWTREGRGWPNREASRFVRAGGIRWHVQVAGEGPDLLLIHGTGAATHSWRDMLEPLSRRWRVIAPDLPGHGFTETPAPSGLSLLGMSRLVSDLLRELAADPALVVGHSAGAAILCRMVLDGRIAPRAVISFNGAFMPFQGALHRHLPALAKLLVLNPVTPRFFAWGASADPVSIERVIVGTGSTLDRTGLDLYRRLIARPGHVAAALGMMANWQLEPLLEDLPDLAVPLVLVIATGDKAVAPGDAEELTRRVPSARIVRVDALGHLAHEEAPGTALRLISEVADSVGLGSVPSGNGGTPER